MIHTIRKHSNVLPEGIALLCGDTSKGGVGSRGAWSGQRRARCADAVV